MHRLLYTFLMYTEIFKNYISCYTEREKEGERGRGRDLYIYMCMCVRARACACTLIKFSYIFYILACALLNVS